MNNNNEKKSAIWKNNQQILKGLTVVNLIVINLRTSRLFKKIISSLQTRCFITKSLVFSQKILTFHLVREQDSLSPPIHTCYLYMIEKLFLLKLAFDLHYTLSIFITADFVLFLVQLLLVWSLINLLHTLIILSTKLSSTNISYPLIQLTNYKMFTFLQMQISTLRKCTPLHVITLL